MEKGGGGRIHGGGLPGRATTPHVCAAPAATGRVDVHNWLRSRQPAAHQPCVLPALPANFHSIEH